MPQIAELRFEDYILHVRRSPIQVIESARSAREDSAQKKKLGISSRGDGSCVSVSAGTRNFPRCGADIRRVTLIAVT